MKDVLKMYKAFFKDQWYGVVVGIMLVAMAYFIIRLAQLIGGLL